jgi:pimeloyl-ACP methyl ester carboxylesterase
VGFRLAQYSARGGPPAGSLEKLLAVGCWPGDADFWGFLDLGDFFVYPKAVSKAKDAAPRLQELIQRLPNLERVDFIAHSLGCRVVLETVARLLDSGRPAVGRVCLMAAAVPVEMLAPGGRFGPVLRKMQALGIRLHVLHSDDDNVLKFTFVPGQALAGGGERTLRALGLKGPPHDMPGLRDNVTAQQIFGAGHSHYWGHEISGASLQAAEEAANFLGLGAKRRKIGVRTLA